MFLIFININSACVRLIGFSFLILAIKSFLFCHICKRNNPIICLKEIRELKETKNIPRYVFRVTIERTEFIAVQSKHKTRIFFFYILNDYPYTHDCQYAKSVIYHRKFQKWSLSSLVRVSSIVDNRTREKLFLICSRYITFEKSQLKSKLAKQVATFGLDLPRPINFLSLFVRFPHFFACSSYFRDNVDKPWSSMCFSRDKCYLPRRIEFISSVLSVSQPPQLLLIVKVKYICFYTTRPFIIKFCVTQNIKRCFQLRYIAEFSLSFVLLTLFPDCLRRC